MIFKQLFDQETWTYSYLLADIDTREAVIIDPVIENVDRDLKLINELGLKLRYVLDTHIHADHITGSGALREATGAQTAVSAAVEVACADRSLVHGDRILFGSHELEARSTPGHTNGCMTFVVENQGQTMAFTGDTLFVRGTGRTDFQQGSAADLYDSVYGQIFSLPDDTLLYPGHDYRGHSATTVGEEKEHNPRLNTKITKEQYINIMKGLKLGLPKKIAEAVVANLACGQPKKMARPVIQEITPEMLTDSDHFRIMDVRQPEEFVGELGHMDGAELVPLATVPSAAASWTKSEPVLVVCRSGARGVDAANLLLKLGFEEVTNLSGGMIAWNKMKSASQAGAVR
jgi:sulfur dioxygenase